MSESDSESDYEESDEPSPQRQRGRRPCRRLIGTGLIAAGVATCIAGLHTIAGSQEQRPSPESELKDVAGREDGHGGGLPFADESVTAWGSPCISGKDACPRHLGTVRSDVGRIVHCCPAGGSMIRPDGLDGTCICASPASAKTYAKALLASAPAVAAADMKPMAASIVGGQRSNARPHSRCVKKADGYCENPVGGYIVVGFSTYCCSHDEAVPSLEVGACVCLPMAPPSAGTSGGASAPPASSANGFISQCEHWDGGLGRDNPVFASEADIVAQGWAAYFREVYGEVPKTRYPICVGSFWFLDKDAMVRVGLRSGEEKQSCPKHPGDRYDTNNKYQPSWSSWIFHPPPFGVDGLGLPGNTWVEVSHMEQDREAAGSWFVFSMGSGVWLNTGQTLVYEEHWAAHHDFCGDQCSHIRRMKNEARDRLMSTEAARHGYDTIQFLHHGDDQWRCSRGLFRKAAMGIEIVAVQLHGSGGPCGGMDSFFRAGWNADKPCHCNNSMTWLNCGDLAGR